jgi:hypothetical protein
MSASASLEPIYVLASSDGIRFLWWTLGLKCREFGVGSGVCLTLLFGFAGGRIGKVHHFRGEQDREYLGPRTTAKGHEGTNS